MASNRCYNDGNGTTNIATGLKWVHFAASLSTVLTPIAMASRVMAHLNFNVGGIWSVNSVDKHFDPAHKILRNIPSKRIAICYLLRCVIIDCNCPMISLSAITATEGFVIIAQANVNNETQIFGEAIIVFVAPMVYRILIIQIDAFDCRLFLVQKFFGKINVVSVNVSVTTKLCKDTRTKPFNQEAC